ncbi:TfpX/TfpZ family type IV pilin accessory protein [Acidovorax lacteus]|uniref:TfpX/TfpZ family type IV pilin accessory protein n=1 Tax=Acidovorax lacteus TaxID=1924988 RepID=UPI0031E8A02D
MHSSNRRLRASGVHLGVSLIVAALAAVLVFGLWYPYPYRELSGGRSLFLLVVAVDVVMGPLITLVVFNDKKPRRELVVDLSIVGALQLAALCYGLWTVSVARPVHLVFEYQRLSVVHASDVDPEMLAKAEPALQSLPWTGPTLLALRPFRSSSEQMEATLAALSGASLPARADLWQSYEASRTEILETSQPLSELIGRQPSFAGLLTDAAQATGLSVDTLRYLPVHGRSAIWTALLDPQTLRPLRFVPVDPY